MCIRIIGIDFENPLMLCDGFVKLVFVVIKISLPGVGLQGEGIELLRQPVLLFGLGEPANRGQEPRVVMMTQRQIGVQLDGAAIFALRFGKVPSDPVHTAECSMPFCGVLVQGQCLVGGCASLVIGLFRPKEHEVAQDSVRV